MLRLSIEESDFSYVTCHLVALKIKSRGGESNRHISTSGVVPLDDPAPSRRLSLVNSLPQLIGHSPTLCALLKLLDEEV